MQKADREARERRAQTGATHPDRLATVLRSRRLAAEKKRKALDQAAAARAGKGKWRAPASGTDRPGTSSVRSVSGGLPGLGKG